VRYTVEPTMQAKQFSSGQPVVETEMLREKANLAAGGDLACRPTQNAGFAARRLNQPKKHFYRGALARSIWTEKAEDLSPRNIEAEVANRDLLAEDLAQSPGADGKVAVGKGHRGMR
jgi:hypothetical protein